MKRPIRNYWMLIACLVTLTSGAIVATEWRRRTDVEQLRAMGGVSTREDFRRIGEFAHMLSAVPRRTGPPSSFEKLWHRLNPNELWSWLKPTEVVLISFHGEVTDEWIDLVNRFPETQQLCLDKSTVSDEQLGQLTSLTDLEVLYLSETPITDSGVAHLPNFSHLKSLALDGDRITDASIDSLVKLRHLERLQIPGTLITDAGGSRLTVLKNLRVLSAASPRDHPGLVTKVLVDAFKKANPDCQMSGFGVYEPPDYEAFNKQ